MSGLAAPQAARHQTRAGHSTAGGRAPAVLHVPAPPTGTARLPGTPKRNPEQAWAPCPCSGRRPGQPRRRAVPTCWAPTKSPAQLASMLLCCTSLPLLQGAARSTQHTCRARPDTILSSPGLAARAQGRSRASLEVHCARSRGLNVQDCTGLARPVLGHTGRVHGGVVAGP